MEFVRQLLSDKDGVADEMPLVLILVVAAYVALVVYAVVVRGQPFDARAFGTGFGIIVTAAGGGMAVKAGGIGLRRKWEGQIAAGAGGTQAGGGSN